MVIDIKCIGSLKNISRDMKGSYLITIETNSARAVNALADISIDESLDIKINKLKNKRSLEQNKKLWALINEIDKEMNGYRSSNSMQIYIDGLITTAAKVDYIVCKEDAAKELKKVFRAVELIGVYDLEKELYTYRCIYGSSSFNTKEMSNLIDYYLDLASMLGLDKQYWEEVFKELK